MTQRGIIVARIKPGAKDEVARIFAESDRTELPRLAGVRHRSLFLFGDVYIHLVETDSELEGSVERIRHLDAFREVSAKLEPYIEPYDPATWQGPRDAMAQVFYRWDA